jgi:hypothetical protein
MAAVVVSRLLTGSINTRQLLYGRRNNGDLYFSPERVQLLAITIWIAFNYLLSVLDHPGSLPDISPQTLQLLGGSQALYLGGKTIARLAPAPNGKDA